MSPPPKLPPSEPVGRRILSADQIDDLGEALLTVAAELWATIDRMRILEEVLKSHGIDAQREVDRFEPGPELKAELTRKREAFVASITRALKAE